MTTRNLKIHFSLDWAWDAWSVWVYERGPRSGRIPLKITIERGEPITNAEGMEPSARIDRELFTAFVSAIKEALAESGHLASSSAAEAELKAAKDHLEDLRKIAFNELGVPR